MKVDARSTALPGTSDPGQHIMGSLTDTHAGNLLLKVVLTCFLTFSAVGLEYLRGHFYYAASPYIYPVFYIFATIFMGLGWGLVTCVCSLVLIGVLVEPADFMGPYSVLMHSLQSAWLGWQARKARAIPIFSEGLRFWIWCGTPLLCLAALPYFQEFFWSGAAIVLHEINSNFLSLVLLSILFYPSKARSYLAFLSRYKSASTKHTLRYTLELGAASLIIIPGTLFLLLDQAIKHDANDDEFTHNTRLIAALYSQTLQSKSESIYLRVAQANKASPNDMAFIRERTTDILSEFSAVCGSVLVKPEIEPVVITASCKDGETQRVQTVLSKLLVTKGVTVALNEISRAVHWPHIIRGDGFLLVLVIEEVEASINTRRLVENLSGDQYLNDIQLGPLDNPWVKSASETVVSKETDNRHFFSSRLTERFNYQFPGNSGADWAFTGLQLSFGAADYAKARFRDSGVFLSITFSFLIFLIVVIRYFTRKEVTTLSELGQLLRAYPDRSHSRVLNKESEIDEFDTLKENISHLLDSLDRMRGEQEKTLIAIEDRARQLTGMVEQSRAFLLLLTERGDIITANKIARADTYSPVRQAVLWAVQTHWRQEDADTDEPIGRATLAWLRSGSSRHFAEVKATLDEYGETKTLTLQFGIIEGPAPNYSVRIEDISDLIATKAQLAHTSRLAELGELATGVAHELNQPLNAIVMSISNVDLKLSRNQLSDDYLKEKLNRISGQVTRASRIIGDLKSFARAERLDKAPVRISAVIAHSVEMVQSQFELDNIAVEVADSAPDLEVLANAQQIEQVLLNLFNNARHVMQKQGGGRIIATAIRRNNKACITVCDTGPGIDPTLRDKIFTPFFTTKMSQGGTGLGLSISYRLIKDHGGDLRLLDSAPGATFEILLPLHTS